MFFLFVGSLFLEVMVPIMFPFLMIPIFMELSQEITDGVNKSAQAVQAAEAGIRQIGSLARQRTICMFKAKRPCAMEIRYQNLLLHYI